MKKAVSISIGSAKRDKAVKVTLFGKEIQIERIGTDGDMHKAAELYSSLDGKVDAFGVGGAVLGLLIAKHWYPFHSVLPLIQGVRHTPVADGTGLKVTLESRVGDVLEEKLSHYIKSKRVLQMNAVDRWGLAHTFVEHGYECVYGDLIYSIGVPLAIHSEAAVIRMAKAILPLLTRLPFEWVYPTGESQEKRTPKNTEHFRWASVIAGDCHYITKYMPNDMRGKVVVTNTTTADDVALFKKCGVKYLVTTTPVLEGRSFGTNMMEAAILSALEYKKPVDYSKPEAYFEMLTQAVNDLQLKPQVMEL